ncbi:ribosomal protein S18-alanine N-acetyltransferase [Methylibium petroleiphilum]|uniref:ribosomal protein S18-alanine N-acetyltransferase n=1 Tax=Methylibium petroleiphilum TaxID=105560 RepID=UPI001AC42186|nr:ribosomal protein S18-alanine N-acetyltransferase [Methylibium petroleiphilum]MBN9204908.1 ribosomal protein S18-alanine N-acetyltransferase [Methylibium petroleiphilum]
MNAVLQPPPRSLSMLTENDFDEVMVIEQAIYDFPWTRGNFLDSLRAGYPAEVLRTPQDGVVGYFVAMFGVDEVHLLNLSVAPALQRRGHARYMLDALRSVARAHRASQLWLEVRISNLNARGLYERYGFRNVGLRRGYYPARGRAREDAVVMSLQIPEAVHGLG